MSIRVSNCSAISRMNLGITGREILRARPKRGQAWGARGLSGRKPEGEQFSGEGVVC